MSPTESKFSPTTILRLIVTVLVLFALFFTIYRSAGQLGDSEIKLGNVDWWAWLLAMACYGGTMTLAGFFWFVVLRKFGQQVGFGQAFLAFFASQLGKYVPGKAMVVVIRTDMVRGDQVRTAPAAVSVFVETLTWIFVGSAIACLMLGLQFRQHVALTGTAIGLTVAAGVLTYPPIFRMIAGRFVARKSKSAARFLSGYDVRTMLTGWLLMGLGWCLNGLSLWLVIWGIPGADIAVSDFSLTLACVSLATVAGFVSLLPGGLGVREIVMIPLLGARFGVDVALVAAIAIRLIWLASELLGAGIIYSMRRREPSNAP